VVNRLAPLFRPPLPVMLSTPSWSIGQELNHHSRAVCVDVSHLRGLAQQAVGQLAFGQFYQSSFARDYRTDLPGWLPYQLYAAEENPLAQELQLWERNGTQLGPDMADIARAIAHERARLRQLGTADSHVLQSLLGEWQRAHSDLRWCSTQSRSRVPSPSQRSCLCDPMPEMYAAEWCVRMRATKAR
jgi:hypothetical protein